MKWIINKFKLLDKFFDDVLKDIASFRVQLMYMAYLFNIIVLWGVIFKGIDYKALGISFGALSICYAFFFHSKALEHNQIEIKKNQPHQEGEEPHV